MVNGLGAMAVKMSSLTFYHDYFSQPVRAVGLLLETARIEHVKYQLKLTEGESIVATGFILGATITP